MVNYVVIKNNSMNSGKNGDRNAYGICAYSFVGGVLKILSCVSNISDDLIWLKALSDKLNQNDVDPVHLENIVEDELCAIG